MQDFLNPKSMVTPGVAGAFMMFLVNGLNFHFPEMSARFTALGISFLIGASVVFYSQQLKQNPVYVKGVYWVLNSLVVFVVGFGTTNLAVDAAKAQQAYLPSIIASAHAQVDKKAGTKAAGNPAQLKAELEKSQLENERLRNQIEQMQKDNAPKAPPKEKAFFQRW